MTTSTKQKAPEAANFKGLHTDTNASDSASHGPIQQAPDGSAIETQIARLALAGHHVIKGDRNDFVVTKYGLTRYCADYAALVGFARQVGVNQ